MGNDAPLPTDAPDNGQVREPEVQLAAMVPRSVKRAVARAAAEQATTIRTIILVALRKAGLAQLPDSELRDRRAGALDAPRPGSAGAGD